jgi:hypothetical protein
MSHAIGKCRVRGGKATDLVATAVRLVGTRATKVETLRPTLVNILKFDPHDWSDMKQHVMSHLGKSNAGLCHQGDG